MECVMNVHGPRSSRTGNLTHLEWCSAATLCYSHWLLLHNRYRGRLHRLWTPIDGSIGVRYVAIQPYLSAMVRTGR